MSRINRQDTIDELEYVLFCLGRLMGMDDAEEDKISELELHVASLIKALKEKAK